MQIEESKNNVYGNWYSNIFQVFLRKLATNPQFVG